MKRTPDRDMGAQTRALAALIGCDVERLAGLLSRRPTHASPGEITDEDTPLGVGTRMNMRRGHPSGEHPDDLDWYVAGYTRHRFGRWFGYVLVTQNPHLQIRTAPANEAFDILERREVLSA